MLGRQLDSLGSALRSLKAILICCRPRLSLQPAAIPAWAVAFEYSQPWLVRRRYALTGPHCCFAPLLHGLRPSLPRPPKPGRSSASPGNERRSLRIEYGDSVVREHEQNLASSDPAITTPGSSSASIAAPYATSCCPVGAWGVASPGNGHHTRGLIGYHDLIAQVLACWRRR